MLKQIVLRPMFLASKSSIFTSCNWLNNVGGNLVTGAYKQAPFCSIQVKLRNSFYIFKFKQNSAGDISLGSEKNIIFL